MTSSNSARTNQSRKGVRAGRGSPQRQRQRQQNGEDGRPENELANLAAAFALNEENGRRFLECHEHYESRHSRGQRIDAGQRALGVQQRAAPWLEEGGAPEIAQDAAQTLTLWMVTKALRLKPGPGAKEAASGERPETLQINAPQLNSAMPGAPVTRKLRANRYAVMSAGKVPSRRLSAIRSP